MNKILILLAHPDLAHSTINRRWADELSGSPERFTVHDLYRACPDSRIDVQREQALVESHAHLVLQFPVYWFSSPPLLKQWQDEVLTYGWAYGSTGHALKGRKVGIAVSAGTPANDYQAGGAIGHTVAEALLSFRLAFEYCGADWQPLFVFHGIDSNAGYDAAARQAVEEGTAHYLRHLERYFP